MSKRGAEELLVSPTPEQAVVKRMDQKVSPSKEGGLLNSAKDETILKIKESAPEWFVEAFSFLISELSAIKKETQGTEQVKMQMKTELHKLENKISHLESEKIEQGKTLQKLQSEITQLESYTRRDNLLVDGIPETPNENIKDKMISFFRNTLKLPNANSIQLSRVHRLGKPNHMVPYSSSRPRTVIIRFQCYPDREAVWKASWGIKGQHVYVAEDFPEAVKENRQILLPCLRAAKRDPKIKKCSLRGDKLLIDGTRYTVNDLEKLPLHLQWTVKGEKYIPQCDSTFFFGKESYLSNFHPAPFTDGSTCYTCSEQYYLQKKCLHFDDETTASAIMRNTEPSKMKAAAHHIKGLNETKWKPFARKTMEKACLLKFTQNQDLKSKLLSSQGTLVEANRRDTYFSCGISLSDPGC